MKYFALFYTTIGAIVSYSGFAQNKLNDQLNIESKNDLAVVSYRVEERINTNFGGSIRTYEVTNLDMITPKNLGENNVRIITPKYAKVKAKAVTLESADKEVPKINTNSIVTSFPVNTNLATVVEKKEKTIKINIVDTYERIIDKGYKTVSMITKVADKNFFEGNMGVATKLYSELFSTNPDLEPVYYYRYGQSLIATGQTEKGNEMIKIFKEKSL